MRKLKLLTAICSFVVGGVNFVHAQTDVTSTYLTNPSFELGTDGTPAASAASNCYDAPYGWTVNGIAGGTRNFGIFNAQGETPSNFGKTVTPADGDYYYLARNSWGDHLTVTYSQTPILPAGIYSLDIAYKIATQDAASKGTLQLKAIQGETETTVVSPVSASKGDNSNFFNTAGWTRLSVPFTVAESGEVTLQIYMDFNPGGGNPKQEAIIIDDVRLYNLSVATEADPADVTGWLVNHSFELDTYTGTKAEGSTASSGSLNYPTGWSFMLKTEGWNNCVNITDAPSDGNLARETWAGTINELKVFQTLTNLPAGIYEISADARTNDGAANDICTYGTVDGKTVYSTPWDQSKMAGTWNGIDNWQTLTARFVLDKAGDAEVGLHSTHFMQFDNFRLKYLGGLSLDDYKAEYSAALAEAQGYIQQGMFDADKTALQEVINNNTLDLEDAGLTQEQLETATANLKAANDIAKPAAGRYAIYAQAKALTEGNTNVDLTSLVVNAGFELGTMEGWTSVNGGNPANNNNWSKVGTWYVERWTGNGDTQNHLSDGTLTHDALVLPAGLYTVTAKAQNQEQKNGVAGTGFFLYANDEKVEITGTNTYSTSVLLTEDKSELVIKFALEGCTGNWVSCDDITLTYVGEDFPAYTLVEGKMNAEVAAAQTAADAAFQASKTVANYNTLTAAIAAAQASKDAYATAGVAIANAEELQTNHNFASTTATSTFAEAIAAIKTPYNEGTLADADAANAGKTLGTVVSGWHAAATSAAVAYLNDGFSLHDFDAALYINTWSTEGESDGSNFKVPFYEYFAGDGNALGANTWTASLTGLENGLYEVSAWVRVRTQNDETAVADLTGISMNVNDGTAVDVTEGDQIGTSRFQLKEYTAQGLVKDGNLNFNMVIDAENNIHWLSFKNIKYTKVRDLNPEEMLVTDEEIAALVATIPAEGTVPTAVTTNLASLKSALENQKTVTAYNDLTAAIAAANPLVAPYAVYLVALSDAQIAGVATETINEQNVAANAATTVDGINACTTALRVAIADVATFNITDYTILNPTAQTKDNWEGTDFGGQSNNVCEYWNISGADFHQTVSLPAGKYCLTVVALQRTNMTGTVYANDKRTIIAQVSNSVVNNRSQASAWFNEGNGLNKVYFELAEASDVVIGLTADATTSDHWTVWKSFQLETFTETVAASFLKPGYDEAMAAAVAYQTVDMFDFDKTALNTAITENTVEEASATIAAYETAIANLHAAAAAAATAAANYTTYNNIVAAIGENTNVDLTEFVTNAGFEEGNLNGWTNGGSISLQAQGNKAYSGHVGEYYAERWHANGTLDLNQTISYLPAGVYKLTANAYSEYGDGILYANEDETGFAADGSYSVYIKLSDKSSLKIGAKGTLTSSTWFCVDNFTLTYVAADYVYTLVDGKMNATVAAAQTAAETAFTENKNGENYQALMTAIAAAQASKDAYATAGAAIANANALKDAHNFATADAITTFADAIAAIETPYNENTLEDAVAANAGETLGTVVTGWHAAATSAAVAYLNDGFSLHDFDAALYINTWSNEGDEDGSNFKVPFYEYFAGDGNALAANTWTGTLTGLENGLYEVSAWVRVRTQNDETAATDATGISMNVNGGTAVDVTEGDQIGTSRFQLKEYTAEGLVKDGNLNFNMVIDAENNIHWLSFKNVKYTKVRDLTPEEEAVIPTAIKLYNGETEVTEAIALTATTNTVTLTPSYEPADATEGVTWASSDESVATVVNGVVTGVAPGTATITATSTLDATVKGEATVTVTYPESTVPATTYRNEGATRTVYTLGENIIKNGSFEYPNAYSGWTYGTGSTTPITSAKFDIVNEGAADGDHYLKAKSSEGGAEAGSLNTSWPIEQNKTYVFGYKVKSTAASTGNQYLGTSLNTKKGQENSNAKLANPAYNANEWTDVEYVFESGENTWLVFNARWLGNALSFDNFYLAEADYTIEGNVDYATAAIPTANIGEGVFQYSQSAIDAANALVQGEATVADVEAAYEALTTLNAPDADKRYALTILDDGKAWSGNAVTFIAGARDGQGGYGIKYLAPQNQNLAQALLLTKTEGNKYKVSIKKADGTEQYMTTALLGYSTGANEQIRTTDDASKALEVEVRATTTDGQFKLWNTAANKEIANNDNNDVYTNRSANFTIAEASQASIAINTKAAGWGTTILPFAASLPEGVKAYTCEGADNNGVLTLVEVTDLEANKPYIIEGAWNETLTGDAQGAALNYTVGLLTGTYEDIDAPDGKYIMQKQNDKVGFYHVDYAYLEENEMAKPKVRANRAYLTAPADAAGARAFFFDGGETTGISAIEALANGDAQIFNVNGVQQSRLMKGLNIIVTKDGKTHKVMVK